MHHFLALREVSDEQLEGVGCQRGVAHDDHLDQNAEELSTLLAIQVHVYLDAVRG